MKEIVVVMGESEYQCSKGKKDTKAAECNGGASWRERDRAHTESDEFMRVDLRVARQGGC